MSEEVKNEHNKQEETLYCECCGECIWDEDVYGNSNITLCHHYTDSVNGGHNSCKTTQKTPSSRTSHRRTPCSQMVGYQLSKANSENQPYFATNQKEPGRTGRQPFLRALHTYQEASVKTQSGFQEIPIPNNVFAKLMEYKLQIQNQEKALCCGCYMDNGYLFASPIGGCVEPSHMCDVLNYLLQIA